MKPFTFPDDPYIGRIFLDPNYRTWEFLVDGTYDETIDKRGEWVDITEYESAPWYL